MRSGGFNLEQLTLGIVWSEGRFSPAFEELSALDVWQFDAQGGVYDRRQVLDEVEDWAQRVAAIYAEVETWARDYGLTTAHDRAILLSEEPMQQFAVPDRELPILDVMDGSRPVASLVPRASG